MNHVSFSRIVMVVLSVMLMVAAPLAEAKRLGGGKSFGQSYNTAPSYSPPAAPSAAPYGKSYSRPDAVTPPAQPRSGGLMKGLLGGLLAGSLIGALMGGMPGGFGMIDMLLMAGLAFIAFRLLKGRAAARPAYAGPVAQPQPMSTPAPAPIAERRVAEVPAAAATGGAEAKTHFDGTPMHNYDYDHGHSGDASQCPFMAAARPAPAADAVPFNLPPGFDRVAFLAGARDHYRTLQQAWNTNDFSKMREYFEPRLLAELQAERATLTGEQHTEVLTVDAELVRAEMNGAEAQVSVKFEGMYRDRTENVEERFVDIWHLHRDTATASAPWMIVGIESK